MCDEPLDLVSKLSAPYSGATLLAILLNRHTAISSDGETFPVERGKQMTCSCGQSQIDCPYYRATARHMLMPGGRSWNDDLFAHVPRYSRIYPLDRALGGFWMASGMNALRNVSTSHLPWLRSIEDQFLAAHATFMANSLRARVARVYADGSKSFRRAELLAGSDRFASRVIHLLRDGRAFANSYVKNHSLPRDGLPEGASRWRKSIQKVDRFRTRFPNVPFLVIRYEDLCREPEGTLTALCSFLDLEFEPEMVAENPDAFHVIGNRMRMKFSGHVRYDETWHDQLSAPEKARLTEQIGPELQRYGYLT